VRYLACLLMEFDHTFTTNRLWGKDECVKLLGVKSSIVKVTVGSNMPKNALFGLVSMIFQVLASCHMFAEAL